MGAFINDGYTETQVLSAESGLHEAIRAEIRPKTAGELATLEGVTKNLEGFKHRQKVAELMVPHIISWDIEDKDGQPQPITINSLLSLRQQVFAWLFQCVCGNKAAAESNAKN